MSVIPFVICSALFSHYSIIVQELSSAFTLASCSRHFVIAPLVKVSRRFEHRQSSPMTRIRSFCCRQSSRIRRETRHQKLSVRLLHQDETCASVGGTWPFWNIVELKELCDHGFHETCHSVTFYFMKRQSKRCCDITTPQSIHTKDESKRGSAFAFIFGVN